MQSEPLTPLGQAFAAIVATLIAALAEHARACPSLAGLIALTIRRLEAMSTSFDALVAAHQHPETTPVRRSHVNAPSPRARALPQQAIRAAARNRGQTPASPRPCIAMRNPSAPPRAPPVPA